MRVIRVATVFTIIVETREAPIPEYHPYSIYVIIEIKTSTPYCTKAAKITINASKLTDVGAVVYEIYLAAIL